ncbi:uncharacterized protein LOC120358154 [Solenopsis invicta]|uniref:uncharacterized protein LOC120358154 n=1 Tax=Solenopsis invicta TaxID=13686 RepID=UPI00193D5E38|nr:uncharacterized protein LOC120358154 [Solenopsis invicta]
MSACAIKKEQERRRRTWEASCNGGATTRLTLKTPLFALCVDLKSFALRFLHLRTAALQIAATYAGNLFGGNLRASFRVRANTWALLVK